MNLTTILIILIVLALIGGLTTRGTYGWGSMSPVGILLLLLLVLWLMGKL